MVGGWITTFVVVLAWLSNERTPSSLVLSLYPDFGGKRIKRMRFSIFCCWLQLWVQCSQRNISAASIETSIAAGILNWGHLAVLCPRDECSLIDIYFLASQISTSLFAKHYIANYFLPSIGCLLMNTITSQLALSFLRTVCLPRETNPSSFTMGNTLPMSEYLAAVLYTHIPMGWMLLMQSSYCLSLCLSWNEQ